MSISRRDVITGAVGATVGAGVLSLVGLINRAMSVYEAASKMSLRMEGDFRVLESNGLPGHAIGDFPNRHDPVAVRPQSHQLRMPAKPIQNEKPIPINMWWFGVAVNGVPFDPSGLFWNSDVSAGWQFEVLHPANLIALGIDRNNAHTQGGGMYHYHGMPAGLLASLMSLDPSRRMMLVGYAADGFPIYGPESPESPGDLQSPIRRQRSSYRLSDVKRASGPLGKPDGRFCEDHIYEPGFGDLDECNGRFGCTPESPDGTYYYVLTDSFPFIPRLYRGQPDASFTHGPPPGVSPPIPQELRAYRGA